jgi:hypothetical protein
MENMEVDIVLGNPKIKCDGYGICKFITKSNHLNNHCMKIHELVKATLDYKDDTLSILFDKNNIDEKTYIKHFGDGYFIVDVDTVIPTEIISYFQITPSVLKRGKYKIAESNTKLSVIVQVEAMNNCFNEIERIAA